MAEVIAAIYDDRLSELHIFLSFSAKTSKRTLVIYDRIYDRRSHLSVQGVSQNHQVHRIYDRNFVEKWTLFFLSSSQQHKIHFPKGVGPSP